MSSWGPALGAGLSFLFLLLVFSPLEALFPAREGQQRFRPGWFTDLCHFAGGYLLWSGLVLWALSHLTRGLDGIVGAGFRATVAAQPLWLQAVEVVLLSDLLVYWGHRWQHRNRFLWRFHAVHHSAEHLDWLAAHREHPLDTIYTVAVINLPAFVLGFPLETLAGFTAFRGLWAIYIHSNVRLPLGPLGLLIGSPELHRWHHARGGDPGNYANLSPLLDVLFGTHYAPSRMPEELGTEEPFPRSYLAQLVLPMLPRAAVDAILRRRDGGRA